MMSTQEKLIRKNQILMELAVFFKNVSLACKIYGVSTEHIKDIRKAYEESCIEGLREKNQSNTSPASNWQNYFISNLGLGTSDIDVIPVHSSP